MTSLFFDSKTVSVALPLTPFRLAVIVVVPMPALVASPPRMVATLTLEDVQVTCVVRFSAVPSLKLPVAVNCCEVPGSNAGGLGVTVTEFKVALVTVSDAVPTSPANNAVMVAFPGASPVASPLVPPLLLTVATDTGEEVHEADP